MLSKIEEAADIERSLMFKTERLNIIKLLMLVNTILIKILKAFFTEILSENGLKFLLNVVFCSKRGRTRIKIGKKWNVYISMIKLKKHLHFSPSCGIMITIGELCEHSPTI